LFSSINVTGGCVKGNQFVLAHIFCRTAISVPSCPGFNPMRLCQRANNTPSWSTCIIAIMVAFLVWPATPQTAYDYIHARKDAMYQHQHEAQARNQKKRGSLTTDDHGGATDVFVPQTPKSPLKSRYSCPVGTYLNPQDRYLRETAMHQWVGLYKRMAEHHEVRKSGGGIHFGSKYNY